MILERWKNTHTWVVGKSHIANNLPCQDRTYYLEKNGVKIIALADGAGSQQNSEIGAEIACKTISELLVNNYDDYLMFFEYEKVDPSKHQLKMKELNKIIIEEIVTKLKEKAIFLNISLKQLSSTLLFFAIKDNHYIYGHIGDGVIVGLYNVNNDEVFRMISDSENGAAANITFFLNDNDAIDHLRLGSGRIENLQGVIMSSDGAADILFNSDKIDDSAYEIISKFNMKTSEEYRDLLSEYLTKIISSYSNDDLSLNILYLEDIDTDVVNEKYAEYILQGIISKKQIIKKSQYCYYLDSSINVDNSDFNDSNEVREYIQWNY